MLKQKECSSIPLVTKDSFCFGYMEWADFLLKDSTFRKAYTMTYFEHVISPSPGNLSPRSGRMYRVPVSKRFRNLGKLVWIVLLKTTDQVSIFSLNKAFIQNHGLSYLQRMFRISIFNWFIHRPEAVTVISFVMEMLSSCLGRFCAFVYQLRCSFPLRAIHPCQLSSLFTLRQYLP